MAKYDTKFKYEVVKRCLNGRSTRAAGKEFGVDHATVDLSPVQTELSPQGLSRLMTVQLYGVSSARRAPADLDAALGVVGLAGIGS